MGRKVALHTAPSLAARIQRKVQEGTPVKKIDRIREKVTILPTSVYLSKMHDAGWSLVALEWDSGIEISGKQREEPVAELGAEEIPIGLRMTSDCRHPGGDPLETPALKFLGA